MIIGYRPDSSRWHNGTRSALERDTRKRQPLTTLSLRARSVPSLRAWGADVALFGAFLAAAAAGSLLLGQDANWDLQNYHYYNPWAWWHGRTFTKDLAAAQIQTFHNPLLDLPFYWMV